MKKGGDKQDVDRISAFSIWRLGEVSGDCGYSFASLVIQLLPLTDSRFLLLRPLRVTFYLAYNFWGENSWKNHLPVTLYPLSHAELHAAGVTAPTTRFSIPPPKFSEKVLFFFFFVTVSLQQIPHVLGLQMLLELAPHYWPALTRHNSSHVFLSHDPLCAFSDSSSLSWWIVDFPWISSLR